MPLSKEQKRAIITEYRNKLKEPLLNMFRWQDFLEGDYWRAYDKENKGWGRCLVCGHEIHGQYVGSHFQQTHTKQVEHLQAVSRYFNALKTIFKGVLKDHGFQLNDEGDKAYEGIWVDARRNVGWAIYKWDEEIEPISKNARNGDSSDEEEN